MAVLVPFVPLGRPVIQYPGFPLEGFDYDVSCSEAGPYEGPYRDPRCWIPQPVAFYVRELTRLENEDQLRKAKELDSIFTQRQAVEVVQPAEAPYKLVNDPAVYGNYDLRLMFPRVQMNASEAADVWDIPVSSGGAHQNAIGIWVGLSWPSADVADEIQAALMNEILAAGGNATPDQRLAWHTAEWIRYYGWFFLRHPDAFKEAPTLELKRYMKALTIKMEELAAPRTLELANKMRQQMGGNPDALEEVLDENPVLVTAAKAAIFASVVIPFVFWLVPLLMDRERNE